MFKTLFCLSVLALSAQAQPLGVGIKLGVPATDAFRTLPFPTFAASSADAQRFTVGPYVELRLPARLAIEVDALHRSYSFSGAVFPLSSGSSWEFPVVVKYRFGSGLIRPYIEGGASFLRLSDIRVGTLAHRSNYGVVAGAGVQLNLLLLKVSPEIRYTGWGLQNFQGVVQSNRNQVAVLVGIGF
jgi:Outer membrane protein beta-barrel domain